MTSLKIVFVSAFGRHLSNCCRWHTADNRKPDGELDPVRAFPNLFLSSSNLFCRTGKITGQPVSGGFFAALLFRPAIFEPQLVKNSGVVN